MFKYTRHSRNFDFFCSKLRGFTVNRIPLLLVLYSLDEVLYSKLNT